ncbi:MAG: twin-arginine translocation signal domain-containing protein [Candidatus Moranbacteria bacterium]|nr:twin-arginine translocation signal domain-containing protein [Candidatus Moranbacteria bacterium]
MFEKITNTGVRHESGNKPDRLKSFLRKESICLNNDRSVDFLNVRHTKESLDEFGSEIRNYIENADVLVSELAVFEEKENQSDIKTFYKAITQIARENGKKMIVADPEKKISDAAVNRLMDIFPILASFGSATYITAKLNKMAHEMQMRRFRNELGYGSSSDKNLFSRRDFLKGIAATGILIAGGLHGISGAAREASIQTDKDGILENFLLVSLDYRDALVAKEILNLLEDHRKISVIYGAAHFQGIKKFLKDPELLKEKMEVYEKTYGLVNTDKADVYDFSAPGKIKP